jgi:thiol-disulfide isomerase/thioredoxin
MPKLGGYRPQQVKLAKNKPAGVKKAPEMAEPLYGQIKFGTKQFAVALDEPKGGDAKLYVDSNGDGDLTDDPATTWDKKAAQGLTQYSGSFQLPLESGKDADKAPLVSFGAYRFDPNDPNRPQLKTTLLYYADYAYEGDLTLGGAKYKAMLADMNATGDFSAKGSNGAALLLDVNGDQKFTPRGEIFEVGKPFNVKGTTWALAFPGDAGAPFKVAQSTAKVPEIPLPPNHSVGAKITPFKAKRMDGKAVNFPADYKGKVVMLDFWATWCPPCMAEVPGLVSAYNQYHPKGIEILGISLDQPNSANKVKEVTGQQGMTWPQVYDGKFWKAAVAEQYGINSIPAAFLVDGDTGEILAAGNSLRGEGLEKSFEAALEKKAAGKSAVTKTDDKSVDATPASDEAKPATPDKPAVKPAEKPEKKDAATEPPPF